MGGEGDQPAIVQEIEIWPYEQVVYAQPGICQREWNAQTSLKFWDTNRSLNLGQTTRHNDSQQKKDTQMNQPKSSKIKRKGKER